MSDAAFTRRGLIGAAGAACFSGTASGATLNRGWPLTEGTATPKLCMLSGPATDERAMRRILQLGVRHAIMSGPRIPWEEDQLRQIMDRFQKGGITVSNMMIGGFPNTIYGRAGRDQEIENIQKSIRAASRAGLPVIEYNFYAHRATEGYFEEPGRGGAGMLSFDYDKIKDLPPLPEEGVHSIEEMWANATYFLKAVVPVAAESRVRLALHPNDPPAPISRGSGQIMGSVEGWQRLVSIVPTPFNGITFDCGVTREMGHDPVEVCRYFSKRDCINHVHFRNVIMRKPREKYTEVFPDEGEVDMVAVMKELVRQKYPRLIYPEHPRGLDYDRERQGSGEYAGWVFNVGYARAMLQAAMEA
ncbi:MAG TPA: mannonate dehydratase [Bryobacteraceae bacterium]|nr:mannonate dehydratase [Bryobacteraceae bacterium]